MNELRKALDAYVCKLGEPNALSGSFDTGPSLEDARLIAAFTLRWAAENCAYGMYHDQVRYGDHERAIPVDDLAALADELEGWR